MKIDQLALEIARRVADGDPVDWRTIEREDGMRRLPLRPLQDLESICRVYRALPAPVEVWHRP